MRRSKSANVVAAFTSALLLASTVAPSVALAQGAKPAAGAKAKKEKKKSLRDTLSGDAKAAFDRGVQLYEAKNPDGAYTEFERAYSLQKDPRLLYNMAIAARDAKKYAVAVDLLKRELKEGEGTLTEDEKKTAQDVLDGLKQFTAPLTVTVNEPGATVVVDDVEQKDKTPLPAPILVSVGERRVTVKKQEFAEQTRTINVSGGTPVSLEFKLEPKEKKGHLVVRASGGEGAAVFVDGTERGPAPWEGDVTEGPHTVEIRAPKFVTETRTEKVEYKGTTVIEVALRAEQGKVRVETDKADNAIAIDGQKVGNGTWEGYLPSGGHQLVVTRDGAEPYQGDLAVQTDQSRTVKVTLRTKGGIPWYVWAGAGVVIVGGTVAAILLVKPKTEDPTPGTISPGTVPVGWKF